MARAHIPMNIVEDESRRNPRQAEEEDTGPLIKYYMPTELVPDKKPVLHRLLDKQPAAWAAVQLSSGILSLGLGVVFAVIFNLTDFLLILFRVPIMTGVLLLGAGFLSNLLYRHPGLLQMCFHSNLGCLCVATVGVILLIVDLAKMDQMAVQYQVEILVLCVTLLDMIISAVLMFFIHVEKRNQREK